MAKVEDEDEGRTKPRDDQNVSRVFIPCPVCQAPIELPAGELPKRLVCGNCDAVLER
jgi:hypothetical protein